MAAVRATLAQDFKWLSCRQFSTTLPASFAPFLSQEEFTALITRINASSTANLRVLRAASAVSWVFYVMFLIVFILSPHDRGQGFFTGVLFLFSLLVAVGLSVRLRQRRLAALYDAVNQEHGTLMATRGISLRVITSNFYKYPWIEMELIGQPMGMPVAMPMQSQAQQYAAVPMPHFVPQQQAPAHYIQMPAQQQVQPHYPMQQPQVHYYPAVAQPAPAAAPAQVYSPLPSQYMASNMTQDQRAALLQNQYQ